jgi:isopenicillin-N N-acyltransferase-like protein
MSRQDILEGIREIEGLIIRHTEEAYLDEMRGIAAGARLAYEDVFLANCGFDLMIARSDPTTRAEMFSRFERLSPQCAAFAAWGQATEGGEMICTHNNDGPRYAGQFQVTMVVRPEQGLAFISPTTVGKVGQHSMMNSHGLFVVGTGLDNGTKTRVNDLGVPLDVIFRHIAQYCATTAQAVEMLASLPLTGAGNFMFADRHRNVELIQAAPQYRVSVKPEPQTDYLLVTNHALVEEIKPYLSLRPYSSSTHYRYQTLNKGL